MTYEEYITDFWSKTTTRPMIRLSQLWGGLTYYADT
jgi:hypothetical protein